MRGARYPVIRRRSMRDQSGAVAMIVALSMLALVVATAMVLDFGIVRVDRQANKSAADAATTAGLHGLDTGDGIPHPFSGVCQALRYLRSDPKFATLNGDWYDGNGDAKLTDGCDAPLITESCTPSDPTTWARFEGTTDDDTQVWIQSGYAVTEGDFPEEDLASLQADPGDTDAGGCDQLAVVVSQTRQPGLGSLATASDLTTRIRSVGRLGLGEDGKGGVAMLLLERSQCKAIDVSDPNSGVVVWGFDEQPGLIQVDSDGTVNCSGLSTKVLDGNHDDDGGGIQTHPAEAPPTDPDTGDPLGPDPLPGVIGSYALQAGDASKASDGPDAVCAYDNAGVCQNAAPRQRVGRSPLDERYRQAVRTIMTTEAVPALGTMYDSATMTEIATCNGTGPGDPAKRDATGTIYFSCTNIQYSADINFPNADRIIVNGDITKPVTFAGAETVIIKGTVSGSLNMPVANRVYIGGGSATNASAIKITGGGGSTAFRMHQGTMTECDQENTVDERARLVIRNGKIEQSGGTLQLCNTAVLMMGGDTFAGCVPNTSGTLPTPLPCNSGTSAGNGFVSSSAAIDWTAPNAMNTREEPAAQDDWDELEDLALWTETAGNGHSITGGGGMRLAGVFMLPNANPFQLHGGGGQDAENCQYIVQRLNVTGGGYVDMRPNPYDVVPIPIITGFTLVR